MKKVKRELVNKVVRIRRQPDEESFHWIPTSVVGMGEKGAVVVVISAGTITVLIGNTKHEQKGARMLATAGAIRAYADEILALPSTGGTMKVPARFVGGLDDKTATLLSEDGKMFVVSGDTRVAVSASRAHTLRKYAKELRKAALRLLREKTVSSKAKAINDALKVVRAAKARSARSPEEQAEVAKTLSRSGVKFKAMDSREAFKMGLDLPDNENLERYVAEHAKDHESGYLMFLVLTSGKCEIHVMLSDSEDDVDFTAVKEAPYSPGHAVLTLRKVVDHLNEGEEGDPDALRKMGFKIVE